MNKAFRDRTEAGRRLAEKLTTYANRVGVIVLALPRGGVPVGYEVAHALGLPLDVLIVRKLGMPGHEELAMGAIASGDVRVLNDEVVWRVPNPDAAIRMATNRERYELERRELEYRDGRPAPELRGRTVILVDDGLATGSSMRAAVAALRERGVAKLIVAVPVGSQETCVKLRTEVDEVICLSAPRAFRAVGQFYKDFAQTSDQEVRELLARASAERVSP
jgi:putative phosphoribosyl transferase